ncbi:MAG: hypothetical protein ABMA64_17115 [Myxococcota bacterium]
MSWWMSSALAGFTPFPTTDPPDVSAQLAAYVERRGDGSCGNTPPALIPPVRPASVDRAVRPYLRPDVPEVQIGDALTLVEHYEVSSLAAPLQVWYLDRQVAGQLRPELALQVLDTLVQVAPPELRPWVDAEVHRRIDQDLRGTFRTGGRVWPYWDHLLFDLGDLPLLDQLRAEAEAAATPARQAQRDEVGIGWSHLDDWAGGASAQTRRELALRTELVALSADQQLPALVTAYADTAYQPLLRAWAAHELRRLAVAEPSRIPAIVAGARSALPTARDDTARARLYDVIRVFGGTLSPEEVRGEAALRPLWQWFELSHRADGGAF